jgi:hypothetical protein
MKRMFILFVSLNIITKLSTAQYIPLHLDIGTCWHHFNYISVDPNKAVVETQIISDTILNVNKYYKALKTGTIYIPPNNPFPIITGNIFFLRNDTSNKKVYSYNTAYAKDELLYDFNLVIGDSIPGTKLIVDTSGSQVIFGVNRKFYGAKSIAYDNKPLFLIYEGIGENRANFDLRVPYFDSTAVIGGTWLYSGNLSCGYAGIPLFGDSLKAMSCYPVSIKDVQTKMNSIEVFPNPVSEVLTISNPNAITLKIEIRNLIGLSYIITTTNEMNKKLNLEPLPTGLYSIEIIGHKSSFYKQIFKL